MFTSLRKLYYGSYLVGNAAYPIHLNVMYRFKIMAILLENKIIVIDVYKQLV